MAELPGMGGAPVKTLNPKRKAANPFEGMERIFAADAEPERYPFSVGGLPCFVEVKPLDSSGHQRLQARVLTAMAQLQKASQGDGALSDGVLDELELGILLDCVSNFQLVTKTWLKEPTPGQPAFQWQHTPEGASLSPEQRRVYFSGLEKPFRDKLVTLCCEASGLEGWDPLGLGSSETPESPPPSPTSPASIEPTGPGSASADVPETSSPTR